ncbi:unnamed protein product [Mycena citricolor]|uniref:Uncharacterized protein n=1 Tax=Mycena citricolor TaxID=2018698 RepID=A0AAD2Q165_9AGAR|nr:unnamed protein product [Mycena citricolor]CAK5277366.1 unnamed protein product [Mycena citricolor]
MLAIELCASNTCALEMRGICSIANALIFRDTRAFTMPSFCPGYKNDTSVLPSFMFSTSPPSKGGRTLRRMSVAANISSLEDKVAPAAV